MKQYKCFKIKNRKYSSNIIVGVFEKNDHNNQLELHEEIILCPTLSKKDGDELCVKLLTSLNYGISQS